LENITVARAAYEDPNSSTPRKVFGKSSCG